MQDIKSLFEKSFSFGIGLATWSRESIEELVEDMVRRGDVSRKDAREFAGDLVSKGQKQRQQLHDLVKEEVTKVLDEMDVARKSDLVDEKTLTKIVREQMQEALAEQDKSDR